jgi:hypothetical protein
MTSRAIFPISDVNGAKVIDFICTPLTSLARSKTRAFVIFPALGATGAALLLNVMTFSFLRGFLDLARFRRVARTLHSAGLAHGMCDRTWNNV